MKKLKTIMLSCLFGMVAMNADAGEKFVITGDLSATYKSGDMVIWSPEKKKSKDSDKGSAGGSMAMAGAMSMGAASSASQSMRDNLNILAEGKLVDGKFRIEGEVDKVQQVYFYVLDAVNEDGSQLAPTKGQGFILEPGELTMKPYRAGFSAFVVSGGKYNDAVFNSWKLSEEYKAATAEMNQLYKEVAGETEEEKNARLDKAAAAQDKLLDLETEGRKKVAMTHSDVLARKLAVQTAWLGGRWMLDAAYGIREMTPDDEWVNGFIASQEAYYAKRAKNDQIGRVGSGIKDFDAKTLDGDVISLKDVRGKNKYVLLEFWASWCGPCRAEIPHMKKAYEKYHDKGFEIFSFTIDDDKDAWETASDEEDLPWIDTGYGSESEPKKLYEVMGVPANYLVDGETGEVIARNLRGHKLDEKLKELLD